MKGEAARIGDAAIDRLAPSALRSKLFKRPVI